MKKVVQAYKLYFSDKTFTLAYALSLFMLIASVVLNVYAGIYAGEKASSPVTDIVLSNIRVYDVDLIFIYGPLLFWVFVGVWLLLHPHRVPFTLKSIALFVFIRSFFVVLTHIGPFPGDLLTSDGRFIRWFMSGGDLFFSAHTGLPFLLALLFWRERWLRYFFLASAVFFGVVVLLGHFHYSIDVLAAFFITYAIVDLAKFFFPRDLVHFLTTPSAEG
ncbi:MAG TPA: phosphatase PAP2-related protein [Candidatus Paceibacterota bacterium]